MFAPAPSGQYEGRPGRALLSRSAAGKLPRIIEAPACCDVRAVAAGRSHGDAPNLSGGNESEMRATISPIWGALAPAFHRLVYANLDSRAFVVNDVWPESKEPAQCQFPLK
ncbi:hypothetical protein Skr01_45850 [Sphaerisporangium krabiense]|nr:hypothetical protein Skr01_45850 [Sphaerisporangium krabiense]